MNSDSSSSQQPSEEQKSIVNHLQLYSAVFPFEALINGSNQSLQKLSSDQNQSFKEEVSPKSKKKGKRGGQELKFMNRGHWSTEQNKKYHWFLEIHYKHFVNRHMRRTDKIFKTMEIFIGTRQAEQCRSHHQKMEKKYLNFISIISNLRETHYASQDTSLMQQQLEANNVQMIDSLASIHQLKAYKSQDDQSQPLLIKKLASSKAQKKPKIMQLVEQVEPQVKLQKVENGEQYKQRQNEQNCEPVNMFDQSRINIGQMMIYHEKDDNSCIFQSMFQH